MPQEEDYNRPLLLIGKRLHDEITATEFAELNAWIYESLPHRVLFSVLTNKTHLGELKAIVEGLKLQPDPPFIA